MVALDPAPVNGFQNQLNMILIFARPALRGKVKTRLARTVGEDRALQVYVALFEHTLREVMNTGIDSFIWWSESTPAATPQGVGSALQKGSDLGERMLNAITGSIGEKPSPVCLIGTDCPGISAALLHHAVEMLARNDVVIGPATDGGYYLIGMNQPHPYLFEQMPWSTPEVFGETLRRCRELGLSVGTLPVMSDIDDENDLLRSGWMS
jgi:uncharacterized protein